MAASPFAGWTIRRAESAIAARIAAALTVNQRFVQGDHWQQGEGWIGPRPMVSQDGYTETMSELERAFTSRNAIGEVVERHASALLGREPAWSLTVRRPLEDDEEPTAAEQAKIDEAEAALTAWWDSRGIAETLAEATRTCLWATDKDGAGRAPLRLYVPRGFLTDAEMVTRGEDGSERRIPVKVLTAKDLPEALSRLYLEAVDPAQGTVYTDDDTKADVGVARYADGEVSDAGETAASTRVRVELCYLDEAGKTVLRTMTQHDEPGEPLTFDLGGRLTMFELKRSAALITPQVQQQQRALNLSETMLGQNVITTGFMERVLLNCQMPGRWEGEGADRRWVPEDYHVGPGTTNSFTGVKYTDASGNVQYANPDVKWRPPTETDPTIGAQDKFYRTILEETDQAHVLLAGDAEASGESRKQARADFAASLRATQGTVEAAGRWVLETALAVAEAILERPGQWTRELRAVFTCRLDLGPISAEEQKANAELVKAGLLSEDTGMSLNGVADVDAEKAAILASKGGKLDLSKRQAEVYAAWIQAGASSEAAATLAGLDDEQVALLRAPVDPTTEGVVEQ